MAEGWDAGLTIVDLNARDVIRHADMKSRVGWTPFDGLQARGRAVATVVRGRVVMRDGEVQGSATGEPVRFMETLAG
jgi:dihydroorotase